MFNLKKADALSSTRKRKAIVEEDSKKPGYTIKPYEKELKPREDYKPKSLVSINKHRYLISINPLAIPIKKDFIELIIRDRFLGRIIVKNQFHKDKEKEKIESWIEHFQTKSHSKVVKVLYLD